MKVNRLSNFIALFLSAVMMLTVSLPPVFAAEKNAEAGILAVDSEDTTPPRFYGPNPPADGGIYCKSKSIGVSDDDFDRVEVDNVVVSVTHPNQGYYFTVNTPGSHSIVVYDKAGHTLKVNIIINADHTYEVTEKIDPSCTVRGHIREKCKYCVAGIYTDLGYGGHSWGKPVFTWSDDGKSASATFTCETDTSHTETVTATISSEIKTPASCTAKGVTSYTASVTLDNKVYTDIKEIQDIEALGHSFTNYASNGNATCTEDGTMTAKCDRCNMTDTVRDEGSAIGHNWENGVCTLCGAKLNSDNEESKSQANTNTEKSRDKQVKAQNSKPADKKSPSTGNENDFQALALIILVSEIGFMAAVLLKHKRFGKYSN